MPRSSTNIISFTQGESMRKYHLVLPVGPNPAEAVSLCKQFRVTLPFPWDSWHGKALCANCERIRRSRGLGSMGMTSMTSWATASAGGWTYTYRSVNSTRQNTVS